MRIVNVKESSILTLDRLKAYANIVDGSRDDELRTILRAAALRVAQYADVALLECTVIDEVTEEAQLWMPPVGEVTSVVDAVTGEDVSDRCTRIGNDILVLPLDTVCTVTYTVVPDEATVQTFAPLVWEMAVAMWDGNTEEESKVYRRIPSGYVVH